jgi:hypothetical protein
MGVRPHLDNDKKAFYIYSPEHNPFVLLYRFSSNVPFLELDYPLSGAKCRDRHFALAV